MSPAERREPPAIEVAARSRAAGSAIATGAAAAREATGRQAGGSTQDMGHAPREGRWAGSRRGYAARRRTGTGRAHGRLCRSTVTPLLPEFRPQHPRVAAHRRIAGVPDPMTGAGHERGTPAREAAHLRGGRCGGERLRPRTDTAPETTQAAHPAGGRPGRRGGAEGTRTPDPATARAAGGCSERSTKVRLCSSDNCVVIDGPSRTTLNASLWPPSWHHAEAA